MRGKFAYIHESPKRHARLGALSRLTRRGSRYKGERKVWHEFGNVCDRLYDVSSKLEVIACLVNGLGFKGLESVSGHRSFWHPLEITWLDEGSRASKKIGQDHLR